MSKQPGKEVIYIDIDDEITTLIDKVRSAEQRIVALVLPKRAAVLQSVVNMKLLKRSADAAKKHLVLITSETSLLPLAGAIGIHVAKTLQSKPTIPPTEQIIDDDANIEEVSGADEAPEIDKTKPVAAFTAADDDEKPIELDNTAVADPAASAKPKGKKNRKLRIPDFNKFRVRLFLAVAGSIVLVVLLYIGLAVMPKATVAIKTDSSAVDTNIDVTFDTAATAVDLETETIPAKSVQVQKTLSQQVDSTGQKDKGQKANGEVTLSLTDCSKSEVNISSGTGVTSGGLTFITQESAKLKRVLVGDECRNDLAPSLSTKTVSVVAQTGGEKYNIAAAAYTVAGFSNVSGSGTQMSGGTSDIVKVVTQADIDNATQQINAVDTTAVRQELKQQLTAEGLFPVEDTFTAANPESTTSAAVGAEVTAVSVTQKMSYAMFGVVEADLKRVIDAEVAKHIDINKQSVLDYGLNATTFKFQNQQGTKMLVTMSNTSVTGTDLKVTDIKKQVAGKKAGEAKDIIGRYPGVTDVEVKYSPFWVSAIPKEFDKITVTIEKPVAKNGNKQ